MAISELLVQSVDDIIRVFPAISSDTKAHFIDLRTQGGGFLVSAKGSKENIEIIQIKSVYGCELKLLSPWKHIATRNKNSKNYNPLEMDKRGIIVIQTKAGETWSFKEFKK